jgi:glycosyl transferase, family 25
MNIMDYFQRIYVINLRQRRDRRREMARELKKIGLSFRSPNVCLFEAVRPESAGDFPSVGARGAFLSHLNILKEARAQQLERILIFEDDLNFIPDFRQSAEITISALGREDWSFFYGGYVLEAPLKPDRGGALVKAEPALPIQTAHFIALHGQTISDVVVYLETLLSRPGGDPRGGPMHVDGAYSEFRRAFPEVPTWLATPQLGYQRSSRSDIHNLRWFDRLPVIRQAVSGLRQLKNRVL